MLQTFIRARTAHAVRPFVRNLSDDIAKASSRIFTTDEDRRRRIEEIIRVDHAGEYGAVRIYEGQMAVLGRTAAGPVIEVSGNVNRQHCLLTLSVTSHSLDSASTLVLHILSTITALLSLCGVLRRRCVALKWTT